MTTVIKDKGKDKERRMEFEPERLVNFIKNGLANTNVTQEVQNNFINSILRKIERRSEIESKNISKVLIEESLSLVNDIKNENGFVTSESLGNIDWNKFARYVLQKQLYKRASYNRSFVAEDKYGDFLGHVISMTEKGIYTPDLLTEYSKDDIKLIGQFIEPKRDDNFDYAGLYSLSERYLAKDMDGSILELPQERFVVIAMHLMIEETKNRLDKVKDLYEVLSKMYLTVATPTMMNAGKVSGGLSSCHILTTEDSLRGIYDDNTDAATFSKNGAGIGIYVGKLRATGSDIKGVKGVSSGIIGWLKNLDQTAMNVDQLG